MNQDIAVFGGGCFWCTEAIFRELKGVKSVVPGYAGGHAPRPTYEQVSSGTTGHAEAIQVQFDPSRIAYSDLLEVFFATHDPAAVNRQGSDIGEQYRSLILYASEEQRQKAQEYISLLKQKGVNVATQLKPLEEFYEAEEYHKQYYEKNSNKPYCRLVIDPKIEKLKKDFSFLTKPS